MIAGEDVFINGDGETSRDFCFIQNVVQANILAATTQSDEAKNQVYNVALGDRTTLNELYRAIQAALATNDVNFERDPVYREFRAGDVRHSQASIAKIEQGLGYAPQFKIAEGIQLAMRWYVNNLK